jgi:hypothetical protein
MKTKGRMFAKKIFSPFVVNRNQLAFLLFKLDGFVKSRDSQLGVIPMQAGIQ